MQAAFQAHVESAVSKTINLAPEAPPGDVAQAVFLAHQLGLKGISVYRYGSSRASAEPAPGAADPVPRIRRGMPPMFGVMELATTKIEIV